MGQREADSASFVYLLSVSSHQIFFDRMRLGCLLAVPLLVRCYLLAQMIWEQEFLLY